jgi:AbrB family looped-hinge helix DNA binding protein
MKRISAPISSKGQITIPREVRRLLGVSPGESIYFEIEDQGTIRLRKPKYSVEDLDGILPALDPPPSADFDDEIEEAKEDWADRLSPSLTPG